MIPAVFFTPHVTLLFGPPRVRRSLKALFRHRDSVPVLIRQSGIACRPALVINAVSPATCSAERRKSGYIVLRFWFPGSRCLRRGVLAEDQRHAAECDQDNEQKNPSAVITLYGIVSPNMARDLCPKAAASEGERELRICFGVVINISSVNELFTESVLEADL